jgi:hypothetical protein
MVEGDNEAKVMKERWSEATPIEVSPAMPLWRRRTTNSLFLCFDL